MPFYIFVPELVNIVLGTVIVFLLAKRFGPDLGFLRLLGALVVWQFGAEIVTGLLKGAVIGNNTYVVQVTQVVLFAIIIRFFIVDFIKDKKDLNIMLGLILVTGFALSALSSWLTIKMLGLTLGM